MWTMMLLSCRRIRCGRGGSLFTAAPSTRGACASRPGMAYTNILSRWMNTEFVNWGFSGSGKAEAEVAKALSEIDDVRLFVINTAGNCPSASYLRAHLPAFLDILRRRYPYTPILLYALPVFPFNRFAESVR